MTTERMMIQLSKSAEILLKRIVDSRFEPRPRSYMMYYSMMIEHLIWEEARRLNIADCSQSEDCSHPQGSVLEDEDPEADE